MMQSSTGKVIHGFSSIQLKNVLDRLIFIKMWTLKTLIN